MEACTHFRVVGIIYYISLWYPRHEQAVRMAIIFSQGTVVSGSGGLLTHSFEQMEG